MSTLREQLATVDRNKLAGLSLVAALNKAWDNGMRSIRMQDRTGKWVRLPFWTAVARWAAEGHHTLHGVYAVTDVRYALERRQDRYSPLDCGCDWTAEEGLFIEDEYGKPRGARLGFTFHP